jgi:uncharacterized protein YceK
MGSLSAVIVFVSALLALPCVTGCASAGAHCEGPTDRIYPGVRKSTDYLAHEEDPGVIGWLSSVIDLPFSAVLDTLCLPFDAVASMKSSRGEHGAKEVHD